VENNYTVVTHLFLGFYLFLHIDIMSGTIYQ